MAEKYGAPGGARIVQAVRDAGGRLEEEGVALSIEMLEGSGRPPEASASAIREVLLPAVQSGAADAILLIGGDDVVPFFKLPNPVRDRRVDPDPFVLSDAPYGTGQFPTVPVGRIPDAATGELPAMLAALDGLGRRLHPGRRGLMAIANSEWTASAEAVVVGHQATFRTPPRWSARGSEWRTARPACLYFNVHGFPDHGEWRAMDEDTGVWQDVLSPADITAETGQGALVFSEACYGASVVGKSARNSIALAFLGARCRGFVGATGLAFGSFTESLRPQFADAVAGSFLDEVLSGTEFGPALAIALRAARAAAAESAFMEKTSQQFVLYGNPLARL